MEPIVSKVKGLILDVSAGDARRCIAGDDFRVQVGIVQVLREL